jgi:hypothetical protein
MPFASLGGRSLTRAVEHYRQTAGVMPILELARNTNAMDIWYIRSAVLNLKRDIAATIVSSSVYANARFT